MKKFLVLLGFLAVLVGCSAEEEINKERLLFETFASRMEAGDFGGIYELLSEESQARISESDFLELYERIFTNSFSARNFQIEKLEQGEEQEGIPFAMSMDTFVGPLQFEYELFLVGGEQLSIDWSEALIFPMMEAGDLVRFSFVPAVRGEIFDRFGTPLAYNGDIWVIYMRPEFEESRISELAETLDLSVEQVQNVFDQLEDSSVELMRMRQDSPYRQALIAGQFAVEGRAEAGRLYHDHEALGRLLGFVGSITAEQLENDDEGVYLFTSVVGQSGIEQVHQQTLRAIDGVEIFIERNGNSVSTLFSRPAVDGTDINLNIDAQLQVSIYEAMAGHPGSAAAVAPQTGEILALVTYPSYNSNIFSMTRQLSEVALWENRGVDPLNVPSRFTMAYSPGSTFKLHTALVGLEAGTLNPDEIHTIEGRTWQPDSSWGEALVTRINDQAQIGLVEAVKFSDNIYFAKEVLSMGESTFRTGMERFTIGEPLNLGFTFPSQLVGSGDLSNPVLLADTGFGQGEILATTLNIALDYSLLSNNGTIMEPVLVRESGFVPTPLKESIVSPENLAILQHAFVEAVEGSGATGDLAIIPGVRLAGKTGTAQTQTVIGEDTEDHGWFVATDLDSASISLAIMVEDNREVPNGTRGVSAMVRQVVEEFLGR